MPGESPTHEPTRIRGDAEALARAADRLSALRRGGYDAALETYVTETGHLIVHDPAMTDARIQAGTPSTVSR